MKNYKTQLEQILADLSANADIEILKQEIGAPALHSDITDIENDFGISIPQNIKDFYTQIGSASISWKFKKTATIEGNELIVNGNINILPVHNVFWGVKDRGWVDVLWFEDMPNEKKNNLRMLRPFDFFDKEDNGCVAFYLKDNKVQDNLILFSTDNGFFSMDFNLDTYLDLLTQTKGIFRWQFLLVDAPISNNDVFKRITKDYLPKLLSADSYSQFSKFIKNKSL